MPTPSNNNPPPEIPSSRSHNSTTTSNTTTCPEEPRSWRPNEQESYGRGHDHDTVMHVDRTAESASPDPEPVSAPTPASDVMVAEEEEDATTETMESRSNTASPRPESRSDVTAVTPASTTGTAETEMAEDDDNDNIHHNKPMELEEDGIGGVGLSSDVDSSSEMAAQRRIEEQPPQSSQQLLQQRQHQHQRTSTSYDMSSHDHHKPDVEGDGDGFVQQQQQQHQEQQDGFWDDDNCAPSMGYQYSNARILPTSPSSFLRPGSKFHGTQQSERQVYDVQVEIKYVDFRESFLCGYLKIQGLTEDNPTLTTYFEGEIIGSKYGFLTQHPHWGANDKIDMNHWSKFTAFRQYRPAMRAALSSSNSSTNNNNNNNNKPGSGTGAGAVNNAGIMMGGNGNATQRENIFMRWKEHFLVPDHRVRTINGASFEGFYYICFNQKKGKVDGIYFHAKSEKFQELNLHHVEDRGCFSAMEFR